MATRGAVGLEAAASAAEDLVAEAASAAVVAAVAAPEVGSRLCNV